MNDYYFTITLYTVEENCFSARKTTHAIDKDEKNYVHFPVYIIIWLIYHQILPFSEKFYDQSVPNVRSYFFSHVNST